jgi:hypothetical protein
LKAFITRRRHLARPRQWDRAGKGKRPDAELPTVRFVAIDRPDSPRMVPMTDGDPADLERHTPIPVTEPPFREGEWIAPGIQSRPTVAPAVEALARPTWPAWVWEVTEVEGSRWVRRWGEWLFEWDRVRVGRDVHAHSMFGPHGKRVAAVLSDIGMLTHEQVIATFPRRTTLEHEPTLEPDSRESWVASLAVISIESRAWALGDDAGGHFYSGCYFVYRLTHPAWIAAMLSARRAIIAEMRGRDWDPARYEAWTTGWRRLADRL